MSVSRTEIENSLYETVAKVFKKEVSELRPETRWKEDLNVKSVHGMKLCAYLNYQFQIKLPMSKLVECSTLADAVDMLDKFING